MSMRDASRVLVGLVALKAGVLLVDATVRLYLGDSASYLAGAAHLGWLPTDRSFTYSLLLGLLVWPTERLQTLLVWQALAGVVVAWFLWHVLSRRARVPHAVAVAAACALALEPAQLYLERMVLAETAGLLAFAGFFVAASAYVARPHALWLPIVAALGLVAVTLRMNYLPVVLVISVGLPVFLLFARARPRGRTLVVHCAIALCSVVAVHTAYRQTVAAVFDVPPSYLPRAGFMQLGLVTPLVKSEHLARVGLPPGFERELRYPLADRQARMAHMWRPGGLTHTLREHGFNVEEIARPLSSMALADNPLGLVPLGLDTVGDYFRADGIRHALQNDLGRRVIPPDLLDELRTRWNYDADGLWTRVTPVSAYYAHTHWWLVACLVALLPLGAANILVHWRTPRRAQALLAGTISAGLVLSHVLFVNVSFFRYLHPLPFFVLVNVAPVAVTLVVRSRVTATSPHGTQDSSRASAPSVPQTTARWPN